MHRFLPTATFKDLGGWTIDTQAFQAMGAPYLMAHGLGKPVADATTGLQLPQGVYHLWAHTRDWTAAWHRGTPAGRFKVLVQGQELHNVMGTESEKWTWQYAGPFQLSKETQVTVALHDLTGFNARCDAIYLADSPHDTPPEDQPDLENLRRQAQPLTHDPQHYDLIVIGGGYAGICTALAAKTSGLRVLLVHDRTVLGGCGSSECRVWAGGMTHTGKYPRLGNLAALISPIAGKPGMRKTKEIFEDQRKLQLFTPGKDLILGEIMVDAELDGNRNITAVTTLSVRTGQRTIRSATLFADCSGDATLARMAGCQTMWGREGCDQFGESLAPRQPDRMVMGHSVLWEPAQRNHECPFPNIDWGIEFNDRNGLKRFNSCWDWETGQLRDQVLDIEYIRDYGLMTILANWSWLKNRSPYQHQVRNMEMEWVSPIGGKRESYRVVGDYVLTQRDIEENIPHQDGTAPITWSIDLHLPDPQNTQTFGETFQSCAYHRGLLQAYEVPYRCLYAKDVRNLFLGGRIISATHVAFSCIRVMRTLGMLGEVVGMAAAICKEQDCTPREVYQRHLGELCQRMERGVNVEQPCGYAPGRQNAYHFMRPVGTADNPQDENVWVRCNEKDQLPDNVPPLIRKAILQLDVIHYQS